MQDKIVVKKGKNIVFDLDVEVFDLLFDNTIARRKTAFHEAKQKGSIDFETFIKLSRLGEVPYPLFFLDKSKVKKIIDDYRKKIFFGVSKNQLSISSRGDINLADISLVLKDITRKQNYLKKFITEKNEISDRYVKAKMNLVDKAAELRYAIGYDLSKVFTIKKEASFNLLDKGLSSKNVYISLYAHHYTPQDIDKSLQFSGIAIKDKKCPYLFIKAGDYDSSIELWGRRLFTAALLLSYLSHGDCRPVTMDGSSRALIQDKHYKFAEEFLMPEDLFIKEICKSLLDVDNLSEKYSVSPSAIVMRLFRLQMIDSSLKDDYLETIMEKWRLDISNKSGGNNLGFVKGINRYNNKVFVDLVIHNYYTRKINAQDAKNLLYYKKGEHFSLEALRHV